jgi:hypothetical protein
MQYVSLDSVFERAEYIRYGLNFERLWNNVNRFLNEVPNRSSLTFIITMNNLNVTSVGDLITNIHGLREIYSKTYQRVWFDTPILRKPEWQNIQLLSESYVDQLEMVWSFMLKKLETVDRPYKGFKDYELQRLQRVIDYMREGSKLDADFVNKQKANFFKFFKEHDNRRKTNFVTTFPDMREFYLECAHHSKSYS